MQIFLTLMYCISSLLLFSTATVFSEQPHHDVQQKKKWTVIIYVAADNNLRRFVTNNIKQMAEIGSNHSLNICVELHTTVRSGKKVMHRYYIEKDKIVRINAENQKSDAIDSGNPHTVVSSCNYFIEHYPADEYALILWNHGSGILDPFGGRSVNTMDLFTFNPITKKLDLDRSISFLDMIHDQESKHKGICWDDTTGNYLTSQEIDDALHTIRTNSLNGQKFSIIGFDACFMQMAEVAHIIKKHADIMVGSQEVELAIGWDYKNALAGFLTSIPDKYQFAHDMVTSYGNYYKSIMNDYTLSALNLAVFETLECNIHEVATLMVEGLKNQHETSVTDLIKTSSSRRECTQFYEPTYIDLRHFYHNLRSNLTRTKLMPNHDEKKWKNALDTALKEGCKLVQSVVFANVVGKSLHQACGISIYFPESSKRIHQSYRKTEFATTNEWMNFLLQHQYTLA